MNETPEVTLNLNPNPPPIPPLFIPKEREGVYTYDREFDSLEVGLAWLTMQGSRHPRIYLACLLMREGAVDLMTALENQLYPWGTDANKEFHFLNFVWEKQPFYVVSLPAEDKDRVLTLIEKIPPGFKLNAGEPHIKYDDKERLEIVCAYREDPENPVPNTKCFPLTGENVFTIEWLRRVPGPNVAHVRYIPDDTRAPVMEQRPSGVWAPMQGHHWKNRKGGK